MHRYPHDWRTKGPVITRATKQWFANVGKLHSKAVEALQNVKMVPPVSSARLENMITGRKEWCISAKTLGRAHTGFYNTQDGSVLATEESYLTLQPWLKSTALIAGGQWPLMNCYPHL